MNISLPHTGVLLIEIIFSFFSILLLARFLLSPLEQSQTIPFTNFIKRTTSWATLVFAWLPRVRGFESSAIVTAYIIKILEIMLVFHLLGIYVFSQPQIAIPIIATLSLIEVLILLLQLFILVIIGGTIISAQQRRENQHLSLLILLSNSYQPWRRITSGSRALIATLITLVIAFYAMLGLQNLNTIVGGLFR